MTSQMLQSISQIVAAIGLVLTAFGGYGANYFGQRLEREKTQAVEEAQAVERRRAANTGVLKSAPQSILVPGQNDHPMLELGDSGAIFKFTGPQGAALFRLADDNHITIVRVDGQVKVSATIRDRTGKVVAELFENEWKVNPQHAWDRNYSDDSLEVRDATGDVVLQVTVLPDRVKFQAKLYDSTGLGVAFGSQPGVAGGIIEFAKPPDQTLRMKIQPSFSYPSERHLGEHVKSGT